MSEQRWCVEGQSNPETMLIRSRHSQHGVCGFVELVAESLDAVCRTRGAFLVKP